ncbi:unnamed protein product [Parajaminaea phylloscopi]
MASTSLSSPRLYAVLFPLTHPSFRIPVLKSVAQQHAIPLTFWPLPPDGDAPWDQQAILDSYDPSYDPEQHADRPFSIVSLPSDDAALTLLHNCTAVRRILHIWTAASGSQQSALQALRRPCSDALVTPWKRKDLSWKAEVITVGAKVTQEEKRDRIEQTGFMDLQGPVDLRSPAFEWAWYEERWSVAPGTERKGQRTAEELVDGVRLVFVGRLITSPHPAAHPNRHPHMARDWIDRLDLKKRSYIGNTSMEAEMSLNMAQMAQSGPGKLIYDPFVGTGSLVVAAAALGAYVMGSDIDGRMMRGKGAKDDPRAETGIMRAAKQYGLQGRFLDFAAFDITQHPWRMVHRRADASTPAAAAAAAAASAGLLDAIIADPPYGVRAGAKRLGNRDVRKQRDEPFWLEDRQAWSHEQEDYVPPTRPYSLCDLLCDLLTFSADMLKDDGRLVFWMPVMNEDAAAPHEQQAAEGGATATLESAATPVPSGPEWDQVAVSTQDFGKWARRLVTLRRIPREECRRNAALTASASASASSGAVDLAPAAEADRDAIESAAQRLAISDSKTQYHAESGRFRANVDRRDFRNQYFGPQG